MDLKYENIINYCRICLCDCDKIKYYDIFVKKIEENILLSEIISQLTRNKVKKNDGLPKRMCLKCYDQFKDAYELIQKSEKSLKKLIEIKKESKSLKTRRKSSTDTNLSLHVSSDSELAPIKSMKNVRLRRTFKPNLSYNEESNGSDDETEVSFFKTIDEEIESIDKKIKQEENGKDNENESIKENEKEDTKYEHLTNVDEYDAVSFLTQINDDIKKKIKKERKRNHSCDICSKTFVGKSNLIDHLRLHANLRNFKCNFCDKSFVQSGNYKSHLRTHTKEKPYCCPYCTKTYNQSSALKIHIRTHTNEKNYVCDFCKKRFTNASDLSKHKRIHAEYKQFPCDYCDRRFAQKCQAKRHMKSFHCLREKTVKK